MSVSKEGKLESGDRKTSTRGGRKRSERGSCESAVKQPAAAAPQASRSKKDDTDGGDESGDNGDDEGRNEDRNDARRC